jgi:hypothetical protein
MEWNTEPNFSSTYPSQGQAKGQDVDMKDKSDDEEPESDGGSD